MQVGATAPDAPLFPEPSLPPVADLGTAPTQGDLRTLAQADAFGSPARVGRRAILPTLLVTCLGAGAVWALVMREKKGQPDIGAKVHRPGRDERSAAANPPRPPSPEQPTPLETKSPEPTPELELDERPERSHTPHPNPPQKTKRT